MLSFQPSWSAARSHSRNCCKRQLQPSARASSRPVCPARGIQMSCGVCMSTACSERPSCCADPVLQRHIRCWCMEGHTGVYLWHAVRCACRSQHQIPTTQGATSKQGQPHRAFQPLHRLGPRQRPAQGCRVPYGPGALPSAVMRCKLVVQQAVCAAQQFQQSGAIGNYKISGSRLGARHMCCGAQCSDEQHLHFLALQMNWGACMCSGVSACELGCLHVNFRM